MEPTTKKKYPIVSALIDLSAAWAAHGLDASKLSLQNSAKMLTRTADTLETFARQIEKKTQSQGT